MTPAALRPQPTTAPDAQGRLTVSVVATVRSEHAGIAAFVDSLVLLPAALGDAPTHEIGQFEEGLRLRLEIEGPQRITRWPFDREKGLADLRVIEVAASR